jgi:hypothetical protein
VRKSKEEQMNQKRVTVCHEGAYLRNGVFILDGSLEVAKDYLTVLSHVGRAGRSIGLASHFEREDDGAISFIITLEEYLNHDNFDWHIYINKTEYDDHDQALTPDITFRQRAVSKGIIQALVAEHVRYIPKENHHE